MTIKEFEEENMKLNILIETDSTEDVKIISDTESIKDDGIKQTALRIKNYCTGRNCGKCVFVKDTHCGLNSHLPFEWKIEEE